MTKNLHQLRHGREFVRHAERRGAEVVNGGRHTCVRHRGARVPIPMHGEIRPGTRRAIIRAFVRLGLAVIALVSVANLLT